MKRKWLTFILMGVFFFLFGACSLNLFFLFRANVNLFLENGVMVIHDGALRQLVELICYAALSMVFYILFKCCEYVLVHWLVKPLFDSEDGSH